MTGPDVVAHPSDVLGAVRATLATLDLDSDDLGASALALRLADEVDREESGRTVAELAGKLLAVLESLGATPAARKAIHPKGVTPVATPERVARDELRARRRAQGLTGS